MNADTPARHSVLLALGSNLGDRRENLERALALLEGEHGATVERVSGWIETLPVGGPAQGKFLNGAAEILTHQSPPELLRSLQVVEAQLGRRRTVPNAPRQIDLDILLYDDLVICEPGLRVPHALMLERSFVLEPAADVAPMRVHPITGRTVEAHWIELRAAEEGAP